MTNDKFRFSCLVLFPFLALSYDSLNQTTEGVDMKLTEYLLAELDREVEHSRKALHEAPEGKYDWKPHDKSMIFGYLANMVATIPMWIAMEINQDELDIAPTDGGRMERKRMDTSGELVNALDEAAANAGS